MPIQHQHLRLVEYSTDFHHTVWRSGETLVVKSDSVLPDCCVRCGEPAEEQVINKWLFWHTPILLPVAFLSWPFYLLLAVVMRRTMQVELPMCTRHINQRRWCTILGVLMLPTAAGMVLAALVQAAPLLFLMAMLMVLSSAVLIGWARNPVWVVRFEENVAFVQNVHPTILEKDSIPVWEDQDWSW